MSRRHKHYNFGRAARKAKTARAKYARLQQQAEIESCINKANAMNESIAADLRELQDILQLNIQAPIKSPLQLPPVLEQVHIPSPNTSAMGWTLCSAAMGALLITLFVPAQHAAFLLLLTLAAVLFGAGGFWLRVQFLKPIIAEYDKKVQIETIKVNERNATNQANFESFLNDYKNRTIHAIEEYFSLCLEQLKLPSDFADNWEVTCGGSPNKFLVNFEIPHKDIVPTLQSVKFVKTRRGFDYKDRKNNEIGTIYLDIILGTALAVIHRIFAADKDRLVHKLIVNLYVPGIAPATGLNSDLYLLSVLCARETFEALDLARVNKLVCLRKLEARITEEPFSMAPIEPITEFESSPSTSAPKRRKTPSKPKHDDMMALSPEKFQNFIDDLPD